MNVGLIGTGAMTRRLLDAVVGNIDDFRFTAAHSSTTSRLRSFQEDYPDIRTYESYDELLADTSIDAVYIATPVFTHPELTVRALEAGKHVLCEKPMALSVDECEWMIEASGTAGKVLQIGYMMRFQPIHQRIKKMVDDGELGSIRFIHAERTARIDFHDPSFPENRKWFVDAEKSGGGVFWDLGSHLLDLIHFFLSDELIDGNVMLNVDADFGVDIESTALMRFSRGTQATIYAGWRVPLHDNIIQVYGEQATLFANRSIGPYTDGTLDFVSAEGRKRIEIPHRNHYVEECKHFKYCIENDVEPLTSGENVLQSEKARMIMYEKGTTFATGY